MLKTLLKSLILVITVWNNAVALEVNIVDTQFRIANGELAHHRPYQVQLIYTQLFIFSSLFCSGTIINERWILTAAHCVDEIDAQSITVLAGSIKREVALPNLEYDVESIIKHQFNLITMKNDIALLKVDRKIDFQTNVVESIALNKDPITPGTLLITSGWGTTETGEMAEVLRQIDLKVEPRYVCSSLNKMYLEMLPLDEGRICASPVIKNSLDCSGDSGGPLTDKNESRIIGIVSYGFDMFCPSQIPYSVYTNVAAYSSWINKVIWS